MTSLYHGRALPRNAIGLPKIGLPLLDWREPANTNFPQSIPTGLSRGGAHVYRRTRGSVSLCNAIAALAGIGQEASE